MQLRDPTQCRTDRNRDSPREGSEGLSLYFLSVLDEHLTASVPYLRAVSPVKHPREPRADLRRGGDSGSHPSAPLPGDSPPLRGVHSSSTSWIAARDSLFARPALGRWSSRRSDGEIDFDRRNSAFGATWTVLWGLTGVWGLWGSWGISIWQIWSQGLFFGRLSRGIIQIISDRIIIIHVGS